MLAYRFEGMALIDRSRAVHEVLQEEIKVSTILYTFVFTSL